MHTDVVNPKQYKYLHLVSKIEKIIKIRYKGLAKELVL